MPTATVTSKGQITLPVELRRKLGIESGTKIDFYENELGQYVLAPKTGSIKDMDGILKHLGAAFIGKAPTEDDLEGAILRAVATDYSRSVEDSADQAERAKAS